MFAKTIEKTVVWKYDFPILTEHATGITIKDDIINTPTVLDAIETVKAVAKVNMKFTDLIGILANFAPNLSKDI